MQVYLVAAGDVTDNATVKQAGFVSLGAMKGNRGDQNYDVPANVDLGRYRAVTIWCRRFSVNFGTAPLGAATAHLGYYDRVEPPRSTQFTIRIENVSSDATLKLSNGSSAAAPTAPLLWVVHTESDPIFASGAPEHSNGLEALAEDGNPSVLARWLQGRRSVVAAGAVNRPEGSSTPGPLTPGKAYEFSFTGQPGQRLTLAMMFAQSNDLFYAPESRGMLLFDATGRPMSGDITSQLILWDAGTEMNQEPGLGPD